MRIVRFDEQVERLNDKLRHYLLKADQKKIKFDEKYIISSSDFQFAISNARRELGIENEYLDDEYDLENWIVSRLAGKDLEKVGEKERSELWDKFFRITIRATEQANLPYGWQDYVGAYIALGEAPKDVHIDPDLKIEVEEITEDKNSIIVRMDKGLNPEDYKKAWKVFKEFLRQPSEYRPYADILKNKIFLDHESGMTPRQIAKRYYPNEYKIDPDAARDKVKKIISRYKRPS